MNEFSTYFTQFKEFEETMKIIIYPDTFLLEKLKLKVKILIFNFMKISSYYNM
jgi:hypothetical protein